MKLEILFPEFCNLFGDVSNIRYLQQCLPGAACVETALTDEPAFPAGDVDLVYLGPMTERTQEKVIRRLLPLRDVLKAQIEAGKVFLFTGNALEVLGNDIRNEDGSRIEGLGLLPLSAKRRMMDRHNSTFLGSFQGKAVMGFKSQFTMAYPAEGITDGPPDREGWLQGLFPVKKGVGLFPKCPMEGVRKNNFFGTYLLGPLLIQNPDFTRYLLTCMGVEAPSLAFEGEMEAAYEARLADFHAKG